MNACSTPEAAAPMHSDAIAEKFWRLTRGDAATGCLIWQGPRMFGRARGGVRVRSYGTFRVGGGSPRAAHRVAWEIAHGEIPAGLVVRHFVCDNPACVNVAHLALGTYADNAADMMRKGRWESGQNRHTRYTLNGTTRTVSEWARAMGCRPNRIVSRIARGWTVERALTAPAHRRTTQPQQAPEAHV